MATSKGTNEAGDRRITSSRDPEQEILPAPHVAVPTAGQAEQCGIVKSQLLPPLTAARTVDGQAGLTYMEFSSPVPAPSSAAQAPPCGLPFSAPKTSPS